MSTSECTCAAPPCGYCPPAFGHCACGATGTHIVWCNEGRLGVFSCLRHLAVMRKRYPRNTVEKL